MSDTLRQGAMIAAATESLLRSANPVNVNRARESLIKIYGPQ